MVHAVKVGRLDLVGGLMSERVHIENILDRLLILRSKAKLLDGLLD